MAWICWINPSRISHEENLKMKILALAMALLVFTGVSEAVFAAMPDPVNPVQSRVGDDNKLARPDSRLSMFEPPKPKYATCKALIAAVQKDIFSDYLFEPTAQLKESQDTECTSNPLFMFAGGYAKRAEDIERAIAAHKTIEGSTTAVIRPTADLLANASLQNMSTDNLDVITKMVEAMDEKQYGSFVRQLGFVNGALSCSSRNSVRVLDLLFAEILAASMDGGLDDPTEQKKCLLGTFNAALNTFDQLQYTGFSLVQSVMTRDNDKARQLLYPSYPVCPLGVWTYDFITGKLVQLRDKKACKENRTTLETNVFGSTKEEKRTPPQYRYLLGYLDQFADPRRFGLGNCSEYYVSGEKNFTCDIGLSCKNTNINPDLGRIIDAESGNRVPSSELAGLRGSITATAKPTRFGLPVGVAEDFLCGRGVGGAVDALDIDKSKTLAAYGQPVLDTPGTLETLSKEGRSPESNASRDYFQCQASTLFETKQDPTTSCLLSAMNEVMREEKRQSMPDGGRGPTDPSFVIGGVKDPSCQVSDPEGDNKRKGEEFARKAEAEKKAVDISGLPKAEAKKTATDIANAWSEVTKIFLDQGYSENDLARIVETMTPPLRFIFVQGLKPYCGCDFVISGNTIYYDRSVSKSRDGEYRSTVYGQSSFNFIARVLPAPTIRAPFDASDMRLKIDTGSSRTTSARVHPARDPGPDQATSTACTSALDRALATMSQCNIPNRDEQPSVDGRPQNGSGYRGVNPLVVDPDPQGAGVMPPVGSIMAGLLACADQYGDEVSVQSGSQYGPGGCLSPMTLCNSKDCKTFQSNCSQTGLWQCSFALCREDGACCGSPHTSRGGGVGDTQGGRTANAIDCGDGRVWNAVTRTCGDINRCGEGYEVVTGGPRVVSCDKQQPVPRPGGRPVGPETTIDANTLRNQRGDQDRELTGACEPGTSKLPGRTECVPNDNHR
jgi:hypothetical protein